MHQWPTKPSNDSSLLDELKQALDGSARCIELAKQEAARIDASLRDLSLGETQIEQALLDNARERRERLSSFHLQFDLSPSPPRDPPPPVPLSLAETGDTAEIEDQAPELLVPA